YQEQPGAAADAAQSLRVEGEGDGPGEKEDDGGADGRRQVGIDVADAGLGQHRRQPGERRRQQRPVEPAHDGPPFAVTPEPMPPCPPRYDSPRSSPVFRVTRRRGCGRVARAWARGEDTRLPEVAMAEREANEGSPTRRSFLHQVAAGATAVSAVAA